MIEFTNNRKGIIDLWQEAFEDSLTDIDFFLDNCSNKKCLTYIKDNKIVSMIFVIDAILNGSKTKYLYAAASLKAFRGKGYMSDLLNKAQKDYASLCLIPATEALANFYKKRGFSTAFSIDKLDFNQADEIKNFLLEGYSINPPFVLEYKKVKFYA